MRDNDNHSNAVENHEPQAGDSRADLREKLAALREKLDLHGIPDVAAILAHFPDEGELHEVAELFAKASEARSRHIAILKDPLSPTQQQQLQRLDALFLEVGATFFDIIFDVLDDPPKTKRRSNRKIMLPNGEDANIRLPNLQNDASRNLGQTLLGSSEWMCDEDARALIASLRGKTAGRIVFGSGSEQEAREMIARLGPRALKVTLAATGLIFEKTRGFTVTYDTRYPIGAPMTAGELARAAGYTPDVHRAIHKDVLHRVVADLQVATHIETYGATGAYNKKTKRASSGWVAPLLSITAVHLEQPGEDGKSVPVEFTVVVGKPWADAVLQNYDVLQVVPGFMELEPTRDDQAIKLAWYYLTAFRYQMNQGNKERTRSIESLCEAALLSLPRDDQNRVILRDMGRFLNRLEGWHAKLQDLGIIGAYSRDPGLATSWPPSRVFTEGRYTVAPPKVLAEVYRPRKMTKKLK